MGRGDTVPGTCSDQGIKIESASKWTRFTKYGNFVLLTEHVTSMKSRDRMILFS